MRIEGQRGGKKARVEEIKTEGGREGWRRWEDGRMGEGQRWTEMSRKGRR